MLIIGLDYHPGFQQIAFVDTETGECSERRLDHPQQAEQFYRDLHAKGIHARIGMEASGHSRWFERLLGELGLELWIGDAARDVRVEVLRRHHIPIGTTHRIDPNLDAERELIVHAVEATGTVQTVITEPGIGPTLHGVNGGGDPFFTDGKVALIVLRGAQRRG